MLDFFGFIIIIIIIILKQNPAAMLDFFFFLKQSNTKLGDECQMGGIGKVWIFLVMSDE